MSTDQNPPRSRGGGSEADGGGSRSLRKPEIYTARKLRREMTLPEVLLWTQLKGAHLGVSFRKQHPIRPYTADFYCAPAKLVIEVDGEAHNRGDQPARDKERDKQLASAGYKVMRIAASDILKDMDAVLQRILAEVRQPTVQSSPPAGRGTAAGGGGGLRPQAELNAEPPLRPLRGHLPVNGEELA